MHFVKLPSVGEPYHVKLLCGAEYSLKLSDDERPWTLTNPQLVTCEACRTAMSAAPGTRPS